MDFWKQSEKTPGTEFYEISRFGPFSVYLAGSGPNFVQSVFKTAFFIETLHGCRKISAICQRLTV